MKTFEYYIIKQPKFVDLMETLNQLGKQGWGMCCHDYGYLIFKRERKSNLNG